MPLLYPDLIYLKTPPTMAPDSMMSYIIKTGPVAGCVASLAFRNLFNLQIKQLANDAESSTILKLRVKDLVLRASGFLEHETLAAEFVTCFFFFN